MNPNPHPGAPEPATILSGAGRPRSLWKTPASITALFLLIPLLGNHFVAGWNWPPGAFARFGAIVFALCFAYQAITRNRSAIAYRVAVGLAFAAAFLLAWGNFVQMADLTRAAALYFIVPIVGLVGATAARLQPKGMARALFVTALAQALVLAAALAILHARNPQLASWTPPQWRGFAGNAIFALLFAASALLFRKAARRESAPGPI